MKKQSLSITLQPFMPALDKLQHMYVGSLFAIGGFIIDLIIKEPTIRMSFIAPLAIGIFKEWWDKYITKTSRWCWWDIIWTIKVAIIIQAVIYFI